MTEVDDEPRPQEVRPARPKRRPAADDLHPAPAGVCLQPQVVEEAVPAVLARVRRRTVTRAERNPAADSESALRPVVRRPEVDVADPASVEREKDLAPVQPVVAVDRAAVPID